MKDIRYFSLKFAAPVRGWFASLIITVRRRLRLSVFVRVMVKVEDVVFVRCGSPFSLQTAKSRWEQSGHRTSGLVIAERKALPSDITSLKVLRRLTSGCLLYIV